MSMVIFSSEDREAAYAYLETARGSHPLAECRKDGDSFVIYDTPADYFNKTVLDDIVERVALRVLEKLNGG